MARAAPVYILLTMSERRRYPRLQAEVLCRPAGISLMHHPRNTLDISLGGMRVYSDEEFGVGTRLDLDVLLPDGSVVRCWAEVAWTAALDGVQARWDVGLKFTDMHPTDIQRLASMLGPAR